MERKRLIVCGDRSYRYYAIVEAALKAERDAIELVIEGECPYGGADRHAANACRLMRIPFLPMPADWHTHGKAGGVIRNGAMLKKLLEYAGPRECWAFHTDISRSRGTRDMLERANAVDISCRLYSRLDGTFEPIGLTF